MVWIHKILASGVGYVSTNNFCIGQKVGVGQKQYFLRSVNIHHIYNMMNICAPYTYFFHS